MESKKQTAVEWLVEQIRNDKFIKASDQIKLINQAKEMEKQQIEDAWESAITDFWNSEKDSYKISNVNNDAEQYYNETFKQ
jgi:hypothetical protein